MTSNLYNIESGQGGLPKVVINSPDGARVEVYLQGGTVTSWVPAGGTERFYLSKSSYFDADKSIRGGVPVCFPQFAARGPLKQMHGFVRLVSWMFAGAVAAEDGSVTARFVKFADTSTRQIWPFDFSLKLDIVLGGNQLDLALEVVNPGSQPFEFSGALHTYFSVEDVYATAVEGLAGAGYRGLPTGQDLCIQSEPLVNFAGLVNRVYPHAPEQVTIVEPHRRVEVTRRGFPDTVVWNIGADLASNMDDLEPDGYRKYICVEAAIVEKPVRLEQGQSWRGTQHITA